MNFLGFFKRNEEVKSFVRLKYGHPPENDKDNFVWLQTLPATVLSSTHSELNKLGLVVIEPSTGLECSIVMISIHLRGPYKPKLLNIIYEKLAILES